MAPRTWTARCINALWAYMHEKPNVSEGCQAGDDGVSKIVQQVVTQTQAPCKISLHVFLVGTNSRLDS